MAAPPNQRRDLCSACVAPYPLAPDGSLRPHGRPPPEHPCEGSGLPPIRPGDRVILTPLPRAEPDTWVRGVATSAVTYDPTPPSRKPVIYVRLAPPPEPPQAFPARHVRHRPR